jgi:hypothetical protein
MSEERPPLPLTAKERKAKRLRDLWQLDIPLVISTALCTTFTVIEVRRASEGVSRAWAYSVQWPLIGIICCWIWYRYRTEGSVTKGFTSKWRANLKKLEGEAQQAERLNEQAQPKIDETDPDLQEWREYLDDLHRREPPGGPNIASP